MLAIKKYFTSKKRRNSAEYGTAGGGGLCTCPQVGGDGRRPSEKDHLSLPSPSLLRHSQGASARQDKDVEVPRYQRHRYRRSISLGQILQSSDGSCSEGVTASSGPYYCRPQADADTNGRASPDSLNETYTDGYGRELSDFEKENLLFLKELDNSYHRALSHSLSNTSLGSTFSEDSLAGDSTPRGGSPYPGRREYPRTAYSPSKTSPSKIIRSISREEDEDDLSEDEVRRDSRGKNQSSFKRKISLPIFMGRGSTSDSSAPSSVCSLPSSSAWWSSRPAPPPPHRKLSSSHSTPFSSASEAKMLLSNRSFSPISQSSSKNTAANKSSSSSQKRPWSRSWNPSTNSDALLNNCKGKCVLIVVRT
ncbi:vitellogenin-1 [Procambarus clarkii]|uniref:vitellogenin-1 n=1 Tax=Procambarus clarkii TaxID=6728 RepID=UPI0037426857